MRSILNDMSVFSDATYYPYVCLASWCRFEIEKKLRKAKKKEREKKDKRTAEAFAMRSVSQRSQERRKIIEGKKDTKKMSALQDLKAKREEKRKQGIYLWLGYNTGIITILIRFLNNFVILNVSSPNFVRS